MKRYEIVTPKGEVLGNMAEGDSLLFRDNKPLGHIGPVTCDILGLTVREVIEPVEFTGTAKLTDGYVNLGIPNLDIVKPFVGRKVVVTVRLAE